MNFGRYHNGNSRIIPLWSVNRTLDTRNMKSRVSRLCLLSLAILIIGCETEPILFKGPYFVRFSSIAETEKESMTKPIQVVIHNGGPALDEDLIVFYDMSGNARQNIDFRIIGTPGQVTIPKGEYFGTIEIQLINNSNNIIRSQDLVLVLKSSTAGLRIGQGESGIGEQFTLTILDDCILGGTYIGSLGSASDQVTISSSDCENYLLSNWNIGAFNTLVAMDLRFIDNGDNTLTIPTQEEEQISEAFATIAGTGVVDPITRKIILNITLVDFENQPVITVSYIPD